MIKATYLAGKVVAAKVQMVTTHETGLLSTHVHFQVLEEIVLITTGKGHQHTNTATQRRVHKRLAASRNESGSLQRSARFAMMKRTQ